MDLCYVGDDGEMEKVKNVIFCLFVSFGKKEKNYR